MFDVLGLVLVLDEELGMYCLGLVFGVLVCDWDMVLVGLCECELLM